LVRVVRQLLAQMAVIAAQVHHLAWCQQLPLVEAVALLVLVAQTREALQAVLEAAVQAAHLALWLVLQELLDKVILVVQVKTHLHLVEAVAVEQAL
jgi:hypothetical protein